MNLLNDAWIPVKRVNGECDLIAPLDLLEDSKSNPVKSINTVRPDFDGAIIQFLIGLYQVLLSPEDEFAWEDLLESPPSRKSLSEVINLITPAFIHGEGEFRFMQDVSVKDTDVWDIQNLLIEINNTHFIKEGTIKHLCPKCALMALLTLELNSPSGGRGHMTSLRGGGPLTTLLSLSDTQTTLWKTIVLNVFPQDLFPSKESQDVTPFTLKKIFPWLDSLPNSELGLVVVPKDLHPYHVYWNVPRRIYLDFSNVISGCCDLCGEESNQLLSHYWSRPNGVKYSSWSHPLTPYYLKKDKAGDILLPIRGKEDGITYANWVGIVLSSSDNTKVPARIVSTITEILYGNSDYTDLKIHVFGYCMDNAKAKYWQEGTLPTILIDEEIRSSFTKEVYDIVSGASDILFILISRIKDGYSRDSRNMKGEFTDVRVSFWHSTEVAFYSALNRLPEAITLDSQRDDDLHPETDKVKIKWLLEVKKVCLSLFKERVMFPLCGEADPSLVVNAELELQNLISTKNPKLCKTMGLPVTSSKSKSKVKK